MTKDEALRIALEVLQELENTNSYWWQEVDEATTKKIDPAITAIKAALEAKDEPVKLRRGDILRCIETDELCTVWATSSSGKTLINWGGNDFTNYTAEQIGELFWIEPKAKDEPDHSDELTIAYMSGLHRGKELAQRTWVGLTDKEIVLIVAECAASHQHTDIHFARAIEAKLKEKNT
jgi:hypothetical protein